MTESEIQDRIGTDFVMRERGPLGLPHRCQIGKQADITTLDSDGNVFHTEKGFTLVAYGPTFPAAYQMWLTRRKSSTT